MLPLFFYGFNLSFLSKQTQIKLREYLGNFELSKCKAKDSLVNRNQFMTYENSVPFNKHFKKELAAESKNVFLKSRDSTLDSSFSLSQSTDSLLVDY